MTRIKTKSGYITVVEIPKHLDKTFDNVDSRVHDCYGGKFIGRLSNVKTEDVEKYVSKRGANSYRYYNKPKDYSCGTAYSSFESMISNAFGGLRNMDFIILEEE